MLWLAQVLINDGNVRSISEKRLAVVNNYRVIVYVDDVRLGTMLPHDFVYVASCRQPWSDIYELGDARFMHQKPYGALDKLAIFERGQRHFRRYPEHLPGCFSVGRVVVFPTEIEVIHAGDVWGRDIHAIGPRSVCLAHAGGSDVRRRLLRLPPWRAGQRDDTSTDRDVLIRASRFNLEEPRPRRSPYRG